MFERRQKLASGGKQSIELQMKKYDVLKESVEL